MTATVKQGMADCSPPASPSAAALLQNPRFANPGPSRLRSTARRKLHEFHEILAHAPKEGRDCADDEDLDYGKLSDDEYVQDLRGQLKYVSREFDPLTLSQMYLRF